MLYNINNSTYLVGTSHDAYATSVREESTADENDFRSMYGIQSISNMINISESSIENTLNTSYPLVEDQKILILIDDVLHDMLAVGVTSGEGIFTVDTTNITSGAIPDKVYVLPTVYMGDVLCPYKEFFFKENGDDLYLFLSYDDITIFPSRTFDTKVYPGNTGSEFRELTFGYKRIEYSTHETLQTSNTSPNTITSNWDVPDDAWKLFENIGISNASAELLNLEIIYEMIDPIEFYGINIDFNLAIDAPKHYKILGSINGSDYTELVDIVQDITIDNLSTSHMFKTEDYATYKYYKLHILSGIDNGTLNIQNVSFIKEA